MIASSQVVKGTTSKRFLFTTDEILLSMAVESVVKWFTVKTKNRICKGDYTYDHNYKGSFHTVTIFESLRCMLGFVMSEKVALLHNWSWTN